MRISTKILALGVFLAVLSLFLQGGTELPLHQKKISDKVLVVWTGDVMQMIATVALATEKGIVVIETSLIRSLDARVRQAIEKEFGRNDFIYLINTHYHHDHVCGNQIYSDATIIGHKNIPAGMREELTGDGLVKLVEKFKGMLKDQEKALADSEPGSKKHQYFSEFVTCLELAIEELQDGFVPTYPSILFEKNLTLDMGDMTVELYSFGGMHTDSDIVIFVPEEGFLAVGDVMPERWPPRISKDLKSDFSVTLENWGRIVNHSSEVKYVNMAHSDMYLSVETFMEQYRYLRKLWDGLLEVYQQGQTIEDAKKKYTLEDEFPYFLDKRTEQRRTQLHEYNIEAIWERIYRGDGPH